MQLKGAIFDMDGTLLDSMHLWENVGPNYLRRQGIAVPPDLRERMQPAMLRDIAVYFHDELKLPYSVQEIIDGVYAMIGDAYRYEVQLKPGALDFLQALKEQGVRLCVATATDRPMVEAALQRLAVAPLLDFILTCSEAGANKNSPDIFLQSMARLDTTQADTVVFEDAWHALCTAKAAGFRVAAVADRATAARKEEIRALADWYIEDYRFFPARDFLTEAGR